VTRTARIWFTAFAIVGLLSGILAGGLVWLIVTEPLMVAQAVARLS